MKARIKFFAAVPWITAWLLAYAAFSWKTAENTREEPEPSGWLASEFTNALGMKFVLIPAESFIIGSPLNEPGLDSDERRHKVTLTRSFYMQTTEVAQGQCEGMVPGLVRGLSLRICYGPPRSRIGFDSGQSWRKLVVVYAVLPVCQSDPLHAL